MFLAVDECYTVLRFLTGLVFRDSRRNCEATVNAMMRFGQLHETANQVFRTLQCKRAKREGRFVQTEAGVSLSGSGDMLKVPYETVD
jgi:hypothetical protein